MMNDREEVTRILAGLRAVEAPENFEGSVRARIAERRTVRSATRPSLLLAAKFAIPMLLLMLLGAFLIVSDDRALNTEMVPAIADEAVEAANLGDVQVAAPRSAGTPFADTVVAESAINRNARTTRPDPQGGSQDMALSQDDTTVFPDGVDPRNAKITNAKPPNAGGISPLSILSFIGISGGCTPVSCKVNSVRPASLSAKAGIQSGDVVMAIDDRSIDSFRDSRGAVTVRSLTVVRNGETQKIPIGRP